MTTPSPAPTITTPQVPKTTLSHPKALHAALFSSQRWVDAFNRGDIDHCADTYTEDAVLVAKPFGSYNGRAAIRAFWLDLIGKGAGELTYERIQVDQLDAKTVLLSAHWTMNIGGGIISLEHWEDRDGCWMLAEDRFEVLSSTPASDS